MRYKNHKLIRTLLNITINSFFLLILPIIYYFFIKDFINTNSIIDYFLKFEIITILEIIIGMVIILIISLRSLYSKFRINYLILLSLLEIEPY